MSKPIEGATTETQRAAIHRALGWVSESGYMEYDGAKLPWTMWHRNGVKVGDDKMPNYPADLNACAAAEKVLTDEQLCDYYEELCRLCDGLDGHWNKAILATAAQRCEAFLRVVKPELFQ